MSDPNKATDIIVEMDGSDCTGIAMSDASGQVWITFARPWWDLASWLWYFLMPGKSKWVFLRKTSGTKVRIRAKNIADKLIRIGRKR
jgi:hypothetical protein